MSGKFNTKVDVGVERIDIRIDFTIPNARSRSMFCNVNPAKENVILPNGDKAWINYYYEDINGEPNEVVFIDYHIRTHEMSRLEIALLSEKVSENIVFMKNKIESIVTSALKRRSYIDDLIEVIKGGIEL